jgi:hypothetical protein
MTVSAQSSAPIGSYSVYVCGTDGNN